MIPSIGRNFMMVFKGGGGSSGGGGGGSSGEVDYPDYLKKIQLDLLVNSRDLNSDSGWMKLDSGISMIEAVEDAWDNSPYENGEAYNPESTLDDMDTRFDAFDAQVTALAPTSDFKALADSARVRADEVIDDAAVNDAVDAFEQRQLNAALRARARLNAGFADINAVMGSAFVIANALLEADHLANVARFNGEMSAKAYSDRLNYVINATSEMLKLFVFRTDAQRAAATLKGQLASARITAMSKYFADELEISANDAMWNINIFENAGNLLANVQGGVASSNNNAKKESSGMSMLSGAITGGASLALAAASVATGPAAPFIIGGAGLLGAGAGAASS